MTALTREPGTAPRGTAAGAAEFAHRAERLAREATEEDPAIVAYALVSIALSLVARAAADLPESGDPRGERV